MNGYSTFSNSGNGAIIITTPDAPINLAEDYSQRTKSSLGITWEEAPFNGGAVIIDYRVSIAEQGGEFIVLASGLTDATYTATGLAFSTTYEFKVESRNSYSYSDLSEAYALYCAFIAEPPLFTTTSNLNDGVVISWDAPVDNGSPVTGYKIFVQNHLETSFEQELVPVDCDATLQSVVDSR